MTFKLNSNSKIISADGTVRPLNSLTDEEYAAFCKSVGERIGRALQDYINTHPEEYDQIIAALEAVGATVTRYYRDENGQEQRAG